MKKKFILLIAFLIIIPIIGIMYYKENNLAVAVLYSDASKNDSEVIYLNNNLHIKRNIRFHGINTPMISYANDNTYIPTGFDDKLFVIDKSLEVSEKSVTYGATYIKSKEDNQLILFNIPINKFNGDKNRVSFSDNNGERYIDIEKSLLLCGDFDEEFIYVIGQVFSDRDIPETHLFIINRNTFELISEEKLPNNIVATATELIDDKLVISSDISVSYFLYYDISSREFHKIQFNDSIKSPLNIIKIVYDKDNIFFAASSGDIIKLDRESLEIKDDIKLKGRIIVGASIKENKLYILSQKKQQGQIALINIINTNDLSEVKETELEKVRDTMPRDIYIY